MAEVGLERAPGIRAARRVPVPGISDPLQADLALDQPEAKRSLCCLQLRPLAGGSSWRASGPV